jgi:leucyl aminopeptidase
MKVQLGAVAPNGAFDVIALLVTEESFAKDLVVAEYDKALAGAIRTLITQEEFKAKKDSQLVVQTAGKIQAKKIVLLSVTRATDVVSVRAAVVKAARLLMQEKGKKLAVVLPSGATSASVRAAAEGALLGTYRFTKYFTGERAPKVKPESATFALRAEKAGKSATSVGAAKALASAVHAGVGVGEAINIVRDLVNEPPNELTPQALADFAAALCKKHKLQCTVWDHKKIQAEGMKLLHAVGRGSRFEPRFVHMKYVPAKVTKDTKRLVVVGKGLTFDSGGLCIKPAPGMGDMKCDMAGAAVSVGLMAAVAALRPDVEVHGIFAAAENMPDGNAYRPGDIWGSLDGKTVEIINTDAEGRLVLADALAYAAKLKPDYLIDHATLTGACLVALGSATAGLLSNSDDFARKYLKSAKNAGENVWQLPLIEELRETMKSDCADMKHTGDRHGGTIIGALFLREFIGDVKQWIHMDIAGPAFMDKQTTLSPKGGTGFGLLTLVEFMESLAAPATATT